MSTPLHKAIYEKILLPELSKISYDADGIVTGVNYYQQLVDIEWNERASGATRVARNIPIPRDGDGVYRQTVKVGDRVRIAFRSGNKEYPYISMIYNLNSSKEAYKTKSGSGMPKGVGF